MPGAGYYLVQGITWCRVLPGAAPGVTRCTVSAVCSMMLRVTVTGLEEEEEEEEEEDGGMEEEASVVALPLGTVTCREGRSQ